MDAENPDMPPSERRRLLENLPPSTPLSIRRAAWLAGYRSTSTLKAAMSADPPRLRVERHGPRVVLTTAGDLVYYLKSLTGSRGVERGRPRQKDTLNTEDAGEDTPTD